MLTDALFSLKIKLWKRGEIMKKYISEFIGTAVLVVFGCGSAVAANTLVGQSGVELPLAFSTLLIAFAFGLSIVAMAYSIGNISGCYINPAVSLAMWITKKMDTKDFLFYVFAQCLGAIAGPALLAGGEALTQLWLFILAPLLGATIAAIIWKVISKD